MKENKWIRLVSYITGLVNQELLAGTKSKPERVRRKMGAMGKRGMLNETGLIW